MKVYGTMLLAAPGWPTECRQPRVVVAAKTKAEAARAMGITVYAFGQYGGVTGNPEEIAAAMSRPGVPFVQKAESGPERRIYTALEGL
jgi:hypothetical protein